ncbi:MAG: hypothetical protein FJ095_06255 [Deltaproteobacteria bacterium]|nr:hypothetical protein [Deltaproteobacteria bacterium]
MRLGIIAAAAASGTSNPVLGERDAQLVKERLVLEDMGFLVHDIDPASDMAEQVDALLADYSGQLDEVLFYVSALVVTLDDGQCFVCLDATNPDVGDSVHDVVAALAEHVDSRILMVVEGRHEAKTADELRAAAAIVRDAVDSPSTGIEAIIALRTVGAHHERIPSRFTVGLLEEVDDWAGGLVAKQVYAAVLQRADLGSWARAELYASGRQSLSLRDPSIYPVAPSPNLGPARSSKAALPEPRGEEPPQPPKRAAKPEPEPPAPPTEAPFFPPPMPVPDLSGGESATSAPKKGAARRPAPPSERVDAATVTVGEKRRPAPQPLADPALPKVVISPKVDPRRRPTLRRIDVDVKARLAEGPGALEAALAQQSASLDGDSVPPPAPSDPSATETDERGEDECVPPPIEEPPLPPKRGARKPALLLEDESWAAPETTRSAVGPQTDVTPTTLEPVPPARPPLEALPPERPSAARLQKKVTEWTVDEHLEAGDEHFAQEDFDQSLAEYKKALGKLGTSSSPARAELYVRVGEVNRAQGNARLAMSNFEKALAIVPTLERALAGVLECHVAQRNWRALTVAEDKLLAALEPDSEERVERLLEFGERALENENLEHARSRFSAARSAAPSDVRPLERLLALAEQADERDTILSLRAELIDHLSDPAERARASLNLATLCIESGDHEEQALQLLERALDDAPGELEALETLASILAENQEWAELERIYRKVIAAYEPYVTDEGVPERIVLAELHRKLALLFRDHLEDPEHALAALDEEFALRPDDLKGRLLAAELATELKQPAQALVHLRYASELDPLHVETYRRLHALGQQFSEPETAYLAASVLHALSEADDAERATYEANRVQGVPAHQRPLRREAWAWLRTKHHDTLVDRVMRAIAPSVLRARVLQLEEKKRLPALPERQDPKTSTASVVRSIGWASQFLGVEPPAIYLDDKVEVPLSARFARHQAMVVGKTAMRGRSIGELAFLAGRHLALRQSEHELVSHMASIDELSACFLAAVKLTLGAAPSGPLAAIVDALAATLASQTSREERSELDAAVKALTKKSAQLDLTAWVGAVERCATRAGYVLCGDLELAIKLVEAEGDSAFSTARERIADLCSFTASGAHTKLRQELGSSLVGRAELPRISVPPPGR